MMAKLEVILVAVKVAAESIVTFGWLINAHVHAEVDILGHGSATISLLIRRGWRVRLTVWMVRKRFSLERLALIYNVWYEPHLALPLFQLVLVPLRPLLY